MFSHPPAALDMDDVVLETVCLVKFLIAAGQVEDDVIENNGRIVLLTTVLGRVTKYLRADFPECLALAGVVRPDKDGNLRAGTVGGVRPAEMKLINLEGIQWFSKGKGT